MIARRKRRFDVIYRRHTLFNCEYLLAKMFNIPLVKEVNGLVADEIKTMGLGNRISLRVMDRIERFNMPKADKIIVVTSRLKEVLQKDYGVPADKIVVIPNGANTDLFKPMDATRAREKLNLNQSNNYVCYVGAFHAWQGIEYLVKSAPLVLQKCPDTRFLIVGDGLIKQELINLAEQLGVSDKMIFTGMVPYRKVPLYMNASDVCVFSAARSFRNERTGGSPLKLYEYMACGRPVVVGNIAGISEDVMDSGSGFVTDPTNAIEMARAIMALLENEQLRKEMGERGKKFTIERHSWMKVAEQVAEVCQSVIKNRR
jgi:glycosyltransferase involved in cell wall biosynthesis